MATGNDRNTPTGRPLDQVAFRVRAVRIFHDLAELSARALERLMDDQQDQYDDHLTAMAGLHDAAVLVMQAIPEFEARLSMLSASMNAASSSES